MKNWKREVRNEEQEIKKDDERSISDIYKREILDTRLRVSGLARNSRIAETKSTEKHAFGSH